MENEIILDTVPTDVVVPPVVDCGDSDCETLVPTDEVIPADPVMAMPVGCDDAPAAPVEGIGTYFATILQSSVVAHTYHLKTTKYRDHIALQEYYDGIVDLIDTLVEQYQGLYGKVDILNSVIFPDGKDEVEYFRALRDYVYNGRGDLMAEHNSEIWSAVDDILSLIDSTIYKLTAFTEHAIKSYDEFCFENVLESCRCGKCEDFDDFNAEEEEEE